MNDVPTVECASEYNRNNSAKVVLDRRVGLRPSDWPDFTLARPPAFCFGADNCETLYL
jgi:hypothetical protein